MILSKLPREDFALFEPHLEQVDLPVRYNIETPNKPIQHIYFLDHGIASVVAANRNLRRNVEIGLIGPEGVTSPAAILGDTTSPHHTYMQVAGAGRRLKFARLSGLMKTSEPLQRLLLKFVQIFMTQIGETAVANSQFKLEERLARWILMAHDRIDGDALPLTHEFLSLMLGVRRAGVTLALNTLEEQGIIRAGRKRIIVVDRSGIQKVAGPCYGLPESELRRLFGAPPGARGHAKRE